jgi:hypothetical protein
MMLPLVPAQLYRSARARQAGAKRIFDVEIHRDAAIHRIERPAPVRADGNARSGARATGRRRAARRWPPAGQRVIAPFPVAQEQRNKTGRRDRKRDSKTAIMRANVYPYFCGWRPVGARQATEERIRWHAALKMMQSSVRTAGVE